MAEKISRVLKKKRSQWGWQSGLAQACACPRQRIATIVEKDPGTWKKPDHTPKNNGNQCDPDKEQLIVHLVEQDPDAPYNLTARHAAMITGENVSANLVRGVRKRNGLEKKTEKTGSKQKIKSRYLHTVSIDVVREAGSKIFGFIQDQTKVVYHYLADCQTAEEALAGLKQYIALYGKPDAVRSDHGTEFKNVFEQYLKTEGIVHLRPLPYNPKANGFIERYFRTLRKVLFSRLKKRSIKISQSILDDFAFLWNYCREVSGRNGKTPADLAGLNFPVNMLERFKLEKQTVGRWTFWHIQGVHGLLHAYLREETLRFEEPTGQKKIA